ncbi:CPBP family intramembrane metalloprotease [Acidithiobacillus caldus]|uniref:CPBP family intramembrane glutamic endopeptidase n=1 Tax=Acidithiobacillus caldus TaxID=33059 RepID=UPI001C07288F|nr:CPBP family intramembrane glutamic endopeptidase [Acidithiobacillus caldus]MBU2800689.1 CPBP family intramembrane metalloprotease [Acidithiobacillus caldus]
MTAAWRSLRPALFLRDNFYALLGTLILFILVLSLGQSKVQVDHWHPSHAWAAEFSRTLLGFGLLMLSAGLFVHYWRIVSEPLVFPVPRFRRDHRWLFSALVVLLAVFAAAVLLRRDAPLPGALLLPLPFILNGVGIAAFLGSPMAKAQGANRWLGPLLLLPSYLIIFIGPLYWSIGTLAPALAIPLALLAAVIIALALVHTPQELRTRIAARRTARWTLPRLPVDGIRRILAWTPGPARFAPWVYGPRCFGILGTMLSQGINFGVFALIFFAFLHWGAHPPPGTDPLRLIIVRALSFASLFGLAWGSWIVRHFEWQSLLLTGAWGDRRGEMVDRWLGDYARHLSVLVAASLLVPLILMALLPIPMSTLLATLCIFAAALVVNAYLPLTAVALGAFRGLGYGLVVSLGALGNFLLLSLLLGFCLLAPAGVRSFSPAWDFSLSLVALVFILLVHQRAKARLQGADWLLTGLAKGPAPTLASARGRERPWTAFAGLLLMLALFLGQLGVTILALFVRGFWIGVELGMRYAAEHVPVPVRLIHSTIAQVSLDFRIWTGLLAYIVTALALLGFLYWYLSREQWRSPAQVAWCPPSTTRAYPVAFVLGVLLAALSALLFIAFPPPEHLSPQSLGIFDAFHLPGWPNYVMILLTVILAPVTEEIVFRGTGLAGLRRRLSPWVAGSIVTLLFVLAHVPSKIDDFHYPEALLIIAALGTALLWLRLKYRSLWPPIFLHALWNAAAVAAVLLH